MSKSIAYFGTPRFSTLVLDALRDTPYCPALIITTPDRPQGRGLAMTASPVKVWAETNGIPTITPENLKTDPELDIFANSEWDLFIVAAYGKILPTETLSLPAHGCLNVHPSLLPRYRGMSPIESQILNDERVVGVSVIRMDEEMDHGPILAQASIVPDPWPPRTRDLEDVLWHEGGLLLTEVIPEYLAGTMEPGTQDHSLATYTKKMTKNDGLIDLTADPYTNYLKYCAYDEWPGTFFFKNKKRVKVTQAEFVDGHFIIQRVIPEGKKEMAYADFERV
ncbi:MAG: methionyl-tRNA formyltransferase [Patescibacteria group bacterium]